MADGALPRSSTRSAGATPPPPWLPGGGRPLIKDMFDVALSDLKALALQVSGDFAHGQVPKLFGGEPVKVGLDALALGDPGDAVVTSPSLQAGLPIV